MALQRNNAATTQCAVTLIQTSDLECRKGAFFGTPGRSAILFVSANNIMANENVHHGKKRGQARRAHAQSFCQGGVWISPSGNRLYCAIILARATPLALAVLAHVRRKGFDGDIAWCQSLCCKQRPDGPHGWVGGCLLCGCARSAW